MEAKDLPFYGVQFHPERNIFEWDPKEQIDHSEEAVQAMHSLARFFISEVKKNFHSFPNKEAEQKALIYHETPLYTADYERHS
jgi:gamma-glutamyl hydrolase